MKLFCVPGSEPRAWRAAGLGQGWGSHWRAPPSTSQPQLMPWEAMEVGVGGGQSSATPRVTPVPPRCPWAPRPESPGAAGLCWWEQVPEALLDLPEARAPLCSSGVPRCCLGMQEGQQRCGVPSCEPLSQCRPPSRAGRSCPGSSPPLPPGICPIPHLSPQAQSPSSSWKVGDTRLLFQGGQGVSPGGGERSKAPTNDTVHSDTQLIFKNNNQN